MPDSENQGVLTIIKRYSKSTQLMILLFIYTIVIVIIDSYWGNRLLIWSLMMFCCAIGVRSRQANFRGGSLPYTCMLVLFGIILGWAVSGIENDILLGFLVGGHFILTGFLLYLAEKDRDFPQIDSK